MSAKSLNWFRKLLYEWSCHTDIEQAYKDKIAIGKQIGRDYCPRCEITRLVEIELGLFTCPYCKQIDTGAHFALPAYVPGEITRAVHKQLKTQKLTPDTAHMEAIYTRNRQGKT